MLQLTKTLVLTYLLVSTLDAYMIEMQKSRKPSGLSLNPKEKFLLKSKVVPF